MTSSAIAFIGNPINRQLEKRTDTIVTEQRNRHPHFIVLNGFSIIYRNVGGIADLYLDEKSLEFFKPQWEEACLLGWEAEHPVIALPVQEFPGQPPSPFNQVGLREAYSRSLFSQNQSGALAHAYSLLMWHRNNRFCSRCGKPSRIAAGGAKRICTACGTEHFPRTDPVAIMLVHYEDKCLLARTHSFEQGRYSCLAGFVEQGETLEMAVRREAREEMGVEIGKVVYLASQPWPFPHSLMLGCHAAALSDKIIIGHDEIENGRWFSREEVALMMAGHHEQGLHLPPSGAIAHFLIKQWLEKKFLD
ncbi:NAD(+) diphosphatase [uncultured Bartonella sp.]|uniref:NAD(+) diphosphatase n=1 Tax=uncultured Bartonella sp. TaxID=104108 RepID=UPI002613A5EC|nr:NAD(+) diphosphatase [uncultured Bartonella sp.]